MTALLPAEATPDFISITDAELNGLNAPAEAESHVWLVPVAAPDLTFLNAEEHTRASRFRQTADANRFITGRRMLRKLLSAYLHIPAAELDIATDSSGKPFLGGTVTPPLHFNLSHSGSQVLIAFGAGPVGIDTEFIDRDFGWGELVSEHFSAAEQTAIAGAADPAAAFYRLWTRKEAFVKATGSGLGQPLSEVIVLSDTRVAGAPAEGRQLLSFATDPGYATALASRSAVGQTRFYRAI